MKWTRIFWDFVLSFLFSLILGVITLIWTKNPWILFWSSILGTMLGIYLSTWIEKREERLKEDGIHG